MEKLIKLCEDFWDTNLDYDTFRAEASILFNRLADQECKRLAELILEEYLWGKKRK